MNRINNITALDAEAMKRAAEKWNSVAKPLHSLGLLEDAVVKIAGIAGSENFSIRKRCVAAMCADNGVVCEGVTQTDSGVTAIVAKAMAEGTSNINCLADCYSADVIPIDVGMCTDVTADGLINRKIAYGTKNIAEGPAMTVLQAQNAISVGIDTVGECKKNGYQIIVTGEMGIGNTTTSSAIAAVLLELPVHEVTGCGAGLDKEGLRRKISAIERAIALNHSDKSHPIELLAALGGFDIAAMAGLFLGGAIYRIPIIIDGFISAAAAAIAYKIAPKSRDFMLCSHVSGEPAARKILDFIGLEPLITAKMRLGEGTGGIMLLPLLDGAMAVYNSAHRFEELPMERYVEQ